MSDEILYVCQDFYGPKEMVIAAKLLTDKDDRVYASMPPQGAPPASIDVEGTQVAFAVLTKPNAPIPIPEGLSVAVPGFIWRMLGG